MLPYGTFSAMSASGAVRVEEPTRPLRRRERAVIEALLNHGDFAGRDQLLAQVDTASVVRHGIGGSASIELVVDAAPSVAAEDGPIPNEATIREVDGSNIGCVFVLVENGRLRGLDVCSFSERPIKVLPSPQWLKLDQSP